MFPSSFYCYSFYAPSVLHVGSCYYILLRSVADMPYKTTHLKKNNTAIPYSYLFFVEETRVALINVI